MLYLYKKLKKDWWTFIGWDPFKVQDLVEPKRKHKEEGEWVYVYWEDTVRYQLGQWGKKRCGKFRIVFRIKNYILANKARKQRKNEISY